MISITNILNSSVSPPKIPSWAGQANRENRRRSVSQSLKIKSRESPHNNKSNLITTRFFQFTISFCPFWAAAPKDRCPVEHRGEFRDVRPFFHPEGAYFRCFIADLGHRRHIWGLEGKIKAWRADLRFGGLVLCLEGWLKVWRADWRSGGQISGQEGRFVAWGGLIWSEEG